jgi:hypothetical protein
MAIQGYGGVNIVRVIPDTARVVLKRNGLLEGECSFEVIGEPGIAGGLITTYCYLGRPHPYNQAMWCETATISYTAKGAMAVCTYAGAQYDNYDQPVYELIIGMEEAPIETHPNFKDFAGSPSDPKNGALFLDPTSGQISADDAAGVFDRFLPFLDNDKNPKAGIESYLDPTVVYRRSYVKDSVPSVGGIGDIVSNVPGPGLPGGSGRRNWLYVGLNYRQRGDPSGQINQVIYEISDEWRLSGRNGWDRNVYEN